MPQSIRTAADKEKVPSWQFAAGADEDHKGKDVIAALETMMDTICLVYGREYRTDANALIAAMKTKRITLMQRDAFSWEDLEETIELSMQSWTERLGKQVSDFDTDMTIDEEKSFDSWGNRIGTTCIRFFFSPQLRCFTEVEADIALHERREQMAARRARVAKEEQKLSAKNKKEEEVKPEEEKLSKTQRRKQKQAEAAKKDGEGVGLRPAETFSKEALPEAKCSLIMGAHNCYGKTPKHKDVRRCTPKVSGNVEVCLDYNTLNGRVKRNDGTYTCVNKLCSKAHVIKTSWPVKHMRRGWMRGGFIDGTEGLTDAAIESQPGYNYPPNTHDRLAKKVSEMVSQLSRPGSAVICPKKLNDKLTHIIKVPLYDGGLLKMTTRNGQKIHGASHVMIGGGKSAWAGTMINVGSVVGKSKDSCLSRAATADLAPSHFTHDEADPPEPVDLDKQIWQRLLAIPFDQIKPRTALANIYYSAAFNRYGKPDGILKLIDLNDTVLKNHNVLHFKERAGFWHVEYLPVTRDLSKPSKILTEGKDISNPLNYSKRAASCEVMAMISKHNSITGEQHCYTFELDRKNCKHNYVINQLGHNADEGEMVVEVMPAGCLRLLNDEESEDCTIEGRHLKLARAELLRKAKAVCDLEAEGSGSDLTAKNHQQHRSQLRKAMYKALDEKLDDVIPLHPSTDDCRKAELEEEIFPNLNKAPTDTPEQVHKALSAYKEFCDRWLVEEYQAQP